MLDLIDTSLEAFFRATVPLSAQDVDVSFEPPDRDWSAKLTRPTVNLFLWDIRRSSERARAGVEEVERDGGSCAGMALPRVELRYLVTAWTSDHGDERALLAGPDAGDPRPRRDPRAVRRRRACASCRRCGC